MEPGSETVWRLHAPVQLARKVRPIDLPRGASMECGRVCDPNQSAYISREQLKFRANQENQLWLMTSTKALNASVLQQGYSMKTLMIEQGKELEIQDAYSLLCVLFRSLEECSYF